MMELRLPKENVEEDEQPETSEDIEEIVVPSDNPPILVHDNTGMMQLRLPKENEEDEQPETSEEIKVFVQPADNPTFFVKRHELTRWSEEFDKEIENGELWLIDGFNGNWNEVEDCISLLKGWEVEVTFDNIKVITTFALRFDIVPLLEEINSWFKINLKTENFGRTLKTIHMLRKLGFSEENLTSKATVIQAVMDFVNNSRKESFKKMLIVEFDDFDKIIINALLKAENNHLDALLDVLVDKIDSNDRCKTVVDLLDKILTSDQADVLCVFYSEVAEVINKIMTVSSDTETLKSAHTCQKLILNMSKAGCASPKTIRLELLRRTRCWRRYSIDEIKSLHENPNTQCWHFAEIVLDWFKFRKDNFNIILKYDYLHHKYYNSHKLQILHELREIIFRDIRSSLQERTSVELVHYKRQIDYEFDELLPLALTEHIQCCDKIKDILLALIKMFSPSNFLRSFSDFVTLIIRLSFLLIILIATISVVKNLIWDINCIRDSYCRDALRVLPYLVIAFSFIGVVLMVRFWRFPLLTILPCLNMYGLSHVFGWDVYLGLNKRNIIRLANSSIVTVNPYFKSILRFLPFFRAELKLLNLNGMVGFDIRNPHWDTDYRISHWYITHSKAWYWFGGIDFVSTFTYTHGELVEILNKWAEVRTCNNILSYFCYYVFGYSSVQVLAITYD